MSDRLEETRRVFESVDTRTDPIADVMRRAGLWAIEEIERLTADQRTKIDEIHATVVRGMPASAELYAAAQEAVAALYGNPKDLDEEWQRLRLAVAALANVLERNQE